MNNEVNDSKMDLIKFEKNPTQIVNRAMEAAKELQKIVDNRDKKLIVNGKQYLFFEDWQTLGKFDRTTAKIINTEEIYRDNKLLGFLARAVAIKDDIEISAADAECCFDEENWKNKPRFQLRSMAQTRACAKALRNCLAFVAVLAKYEPTPAEEMDNIKSESTNKNPATPKQINYIKEKMIGSSKSTLKEKQEWNKLIADGINFEEAYEKLVWWMGNSKKGIIGERKKREEAEKKEKDNPKEEPNPNLEKIKITPEDIVKLEEMAVNANLETWGDIVLEGCKIPYKDAHIFKPGMNEEEAKKELIDNPEKFLILINQFKKIRR